jgi:hypothetical protein
MEKEVLHIIALDSNDVIVNANNAMKGGKYFCPSCKNELILKKSGKTGIGSRRPHFAHKSLSVNCSPESVLHYSFKIMLLEYINDNIIKKIPINIILECNLCHSKILMNILRNCIKVKDEYDMKICRPDIALIEENENVYAVFEIVVTHKPEDNIVNYYQKNNIILFQIELDSEDDLENINETLSKKVKIKTRPDYFNVCMNPNCVSKKKIYRRNIRRSRRF